jgi:hypothetical protein
MKTPFRCEIAGMSFFRRPKLAKEKGLSGYLNSRNPSAVSFMEGDAEKSACIGAHRTTDVLPIERPAGLAKITPSIVGAVSIDVVNFSCWPGALLQEKSDSVGLERSTKERYSPISLRVQVSGDLSNASAFSGALSPSDKPCFRLVGEIFREALVVAKDVFSHCAVLSRSGQGRALRQQRYRPVFMRENSAFCKVGAR